MADRRVEPEGSAKWYCTGTDKSPWDTNTTMLHRSRPGRTRKRRPNRSAMPSAPGRVRQALADFIPQTSQCVLHPC